MAPKVNPPHRAEHLGSLKRPRYLLQKREELDGERCTPDQLRAAEDDAIKAVVQMQRDVGIQTITDGEFRRFVVTSFFPRSFTSMLMLIGLDICFSMACLIGWMG